MLLRLVVAAVLGSAVGLERERGEWAAGLRTHMLVATGACLFMIVSAYGFTGVLGRPAVVLDPSRIAAQVVTGVGFLGAGTILLRGQIVRGLTTAASLWAVAAVGLASGGGLYAEAVSTTALVLLILAGVKPVERRLFQRRRHRSVFLTIDRAHASLAAIEAAVSRTGARIAELNVRRTGEGVDDEVELALARISPEEVALLVESAREVEGVLSVRVPSGL